MYIVDINTDVRGLSLEELEELLYDNFDFEGIRADADTDMRELIIQVLDEFEEFCSFTLEDLAHNVEAKELGYADWNQMMDDILYDMGIDEAS